VLGSVGAQGQNTQGRAIKGDEALKEKSTQAAAASTTGRTSRQTKPAEAPPTGILAYIRGKHGSTSQKLDYPLFEGSITLGRGKDVDIMLLDTKVSRHHAEILYKEGDFIFVDSQPTNPSYVNGKAYNGPHVIKDGDEFTMGQTKFIFTREK
jgi:pSer/pThr/pTyr-binding forkhead associated (FHA) protein